MKTNLAYIDDVVERETEHRAANVAVSDKERADIRKEATTPVAGFRVFDEDKERELLDAAIKKRTDAINAFRKDRADVRKTLDGLGVSPLAVVPRLAWHSICLKAKLFRFKPDSENRVHVSQWAFADFTERNVNKWAQNNHAAYLEKLFPGYVEADNRPYSVQATQATLVLPAPPADVVATLLKAKSLALHVAAVADAISLAETPLELMQHQLRRDEEERKYQEWLKNDPIVYHEHGNATAIIAQFGDFPVEKEVVDSVIRADDFLPDRVSAETLSVFSSQDSIRELYELQRAEMMRMAGMRAGTSPPFAGPSGFGSFGPFGN